MRKKLGLGAAIGAFLLLATMSTQQSFADSDDIHHVLLISIDGFHALDYLNCSKGIPGFNGGNPYCPNLAALGAHGRELSGYFDLEAVGFVSRPDGADDRWHRRARWAPIMMSLMTARSIRRRTTTGNGLLGGPARLAQPRPAPALNTTKASTSMSRASPIRCFSTAARRRRRRDQLDRSDPAGTRRELQSGLSVELCPRQHDFRSHPRRGRVYRLVRQASVVFVGGRPDRDLHGHECRRLLLAGNKLRFREFRGPARHPVAEHLQA